MGDVGKYSVVITGLSCTAEEFRAKALGMGVKADMAEKILSTLPCKVKVGQALENAKKYQLAFQQAGGVVEVRPEWKTAAAANGGATVMGFGAGTPPPPAPAPPPPAPPPPVAAAAPLPSGRTPLATAAIMLQQDPEEQVEAVFEQEPVPAAAVGSMAPSADALELGSDDGGAFELATGAEQAFQAFSAPSASSAPAAGGDDSELSLEDATSPFAGHGHGAAPAAAAGAADVPLDLGLEGGDAGHAPLPAAVRPPPAARAPTEKPSAQWEVKDRSHLVKPVSFGALAVALLAAGWIVGGCKAHTKLHDFEQELGGKLTNSMIKLQMGGGAVSYEDVETLVVTIAKQHDVNIKPDEMEIRIRPSGFLAMCPEAAPPNTPCNVVGGPEDFHRFKMGDQVRLRMKAQEMARTGVPPDFLIEIRAYASTRWLFRKKGWVFEYPLLVAKAVPTQL